MTLTLEGVEKVVNGRTHIHPTSLTLEKGTMNVLLGPTLAGKTSMMRLMAGLDKPTAGRLLWNGADVTGMRVQDRAVAMVYQQFINYPAFTVYENIASPMRLMGKPKAEIEAAVRQDRRAPRPDADAAAQAARAFRRPAAALRAGARAGQGRGPRAPRRAARQPRLQAARGAARRDPADLRGIGRDLRLRHHRARGGAAPRRQYRDALGGPRDPVRPDAAGLPRAGGRRRRRGSSPTRR